MYLARGRKGNPDIWVINVSILSLNLLAMMTLHLLNRECGIGSTHVNKMSPIPKLVKSQHNAHCVYLNIKAPGNVQLKTIERKNMKS